MSAAQGMRKWYLWPRSRGGFSELPFDVAAAGDQPLKPGHGDGEPHTDSCFVGKVG